MIRYRITKIAATSVGLAMALGAASPLGAVTIAELQAQINALMAQLAALQGTTVTTTACTFTRNLTVGVSGADVTCLQNYLTGTGHFTFSGGSTGYFGPITQAAVAAWQAANSVAPAVGYFGPISQAKYTSVAGTTVPGTTVPGTTTPSPGITTPGVEGTITASLNATPAAVKLYEGETKVGVLGIKLEAKASDIRIERVKLDLDHTTGTTLADTNFYRKIANKVYVMDGSTVLGSMDLNINTIVKDGANYFITVSGLNFIVPKGGTKVLTVALDAMGTWDSDFNSETFTVGVPVDGVRGVDGAGVNQYSPATAFTRDFTSEDSLTDAATMAVSLSNSTPITNQVIAEMGTSNNEYDGLPVLKADFRAEKDNVTITDLVVDIVRGQTTNAATATTAYLLDSNGATVGSAAVAGTDLTTMGATFSDIDYVVPRDTTKTLTVTLDIDSATASATTFAADIDTADVTSENSAGGAITETGSAAGKTITVRKLGPQVTLVSKSISTNGVPQLLGPSTNVSTSTLTATFTIKIKALGADLLFGTVASGTPLIASSTASFKVYRNGAYDSAVSSEATSTAYTIPSTCTSGTSNSCTLAEGSEVTIPVTFQIQGRKKFASETPGVPNPTGLYAVGFEGITWTSADTIAAATTTTFMAGEADWRTADVSFP